MNNIIKMDEYRSYSLDQLRDWLRDATNSEAEPQEVYDCIIDTIESDIAYHKACLNHNKELLSLLNTVTTV